MNSWGAGAAAVLLSGTAAFSQNEACRYTAALAAPNADYHRVELPVSAMTLSPYASAKQARGYPDDLRVLGVTGAGDTVEVPYVYEAARASVAERLYLERVNAGLVGSATRVTVEAPRHGDGRPRELRLLELELGNANFEGRVTVEGANRLGDFETVAEDLRIVGLVDEGAAFEYARVRFPPARYRYYRLTVSDIPELRLDRVAAYRTERSAEPPRRSYGGRLATSTPRRDGRATELVFDLEDRALVNRITVHVADTTPYARFTNVRLALRPEDAAPLGYRDRPTGRARGELTSEDSVLYVPSAVAEVVSILVKDGDDRPLQVDSVTVEGPRHFLVVRFPAEVEQAYLRYGCAALGASDYDLARLRGQIPDTLTPLAVGAVEEAAEAVAGEVPPDWSHIWLWTALVIVGVVLTVLGVRLLR